MTLKSFVYDLLIERFPEDKSKITKIVENKEIFNYFVKAFTPKTEDPENNYEGLEKLGDAIFDDHLIRYIYTTYRKLKNSEISERQMAYTKDWFKSNHRMTDFAEIFMLSDHIKGYGKESVKRSGDKVQADVFEALIGAIDQAFAAVDNDELGAVRYTYAFVIHLFSPNFARKDGKGRFEIDFDDPNRYKDPTTILNETIKNDKKSGLEMEGPNMREEGALHIATIKITNKSEGKIRTYVGIGKKKKEAQLSVAQKVIEGEKIKYSEIVSKKASFGEIVRTEEEGVVYHQAIIGDKLYKFPSNDSIEFFLKYKSEINPTKDRRVTDGSRRQDKKPFVFKK